MTTKCSPVVHIKNLSTEINFQVKMATGVYFTDQKLKNADSAFWRQNCNFLAENVFEYRLKLI